MAELLKKKKGHGDALTVTGRTMAENLADIAPPDPDGKILRALDNPIHRTGGITILHGSLAPEGAVVKSAGFDSEVNETANGMTVKLGATGTYVAALLKTLSRFSPASFTIQPG